MARPRTPTNILDARGSFETHPERRKLRDQEPKAKPVGSPPKWLCKEEKSIWREIVKECAEGVFQSSDRISLGIASKLEHQRRIDINFPSSKLNILTTLLGKFGMTPSDRSKVMIPKSNPIDEWEDF